jgi:hypothetical protein
MLILLSFALALGVYFGLRQFLWKSDVIPTIYRILGKEASQQDYYLKFKAAYIHVVAVLTLFSFGGWLVFAGIFTPFFKMMIGFAVVAGYHWIKGVNK